MTFENKFEIFAKFCKIFKGHPWGSLWINIKVEWISVVLESWASPWYLFHCQSVKSVFRSIWQSFISPVFKNKSWKDLWFSIKKSVNKCLTTPVWSDLQLPCGVESSQRVWWVHRYLLKKEQKSVYSYREVCVQQKIIVTMSRRKVCSQLPWGVGSEEWVFLFLSNIFVEHHVASHFVTVKLNIHLS